jgi:hypothetical protein
LISAKEEIEREQKMPTRIKHPYADTPYDVLSDPADPKVGVVTPDTPRQALRAQKAKVLAQRKRDNRDILEADRALMSISGRLGCDVFLRTMLDRSGDIKELIEKHRDPPMIAQANVDWTQGLSYWLEPPVGEIPLQPVQISRSTSYDDPRADLSAVEFDS